jgi:hypothetical protein
LSVAGIAGYSKAMAKYKINKVMDQVSTLSANIKTLFASVGNYKGLSGNEQAFKLGLFPDDMVKLCKGAYSASCIKNGMNGDVTVAPTSTTTGTGNDAVTTVDGKGFTLKFEGLTKDACTALFASDWGGAAGFISIASGSTSYTPATLATTGVYTAAKTACVPAQNATDPNNAYSITWTFY